MNDFHISPPFTWNYFKQTNAPYNIRNTQLLELSKCKVKRYGLNTALFKGSRVHFHGKNCQRILRKQSLYNISKKKKKKIENRQGDHVLVECS